MAKDLREPIVKECRCVNCHEVFRWYETEPQYVADLTAKLATAEDRVKELEAELRSAGGGIAHEALSTPSSTKHLDEYVAEKAKELRSGGPKEYREMLNDVRMLLIKEKAAPC